MKSLKFKTLSLLCLALFIGFVVRGHVTQDPDFGWHLQTGLLIAAKGIPRTDPFSYTMPSYAFVDHEWLSDVILAKTYERFGMWPLEISFALFGIMTLLILVMKENKKWAILPFFLVGGTLFDFMGIRIQILSWIFLALLMVVMLHKEVWQKWRFALPVLFLVWANVHGSFAIGLVILGIFVIGRSIESRTIKWTEYGVLLLSILATLVNPYGYHLWVEVSKSLTDTSLRWEIQEWYPAIYFTNMTFWIYFAVSTFLLLRYWRKFSPSVLVIYFVLLVSAFASMRNIAVFVIVSFIPTVQVFTYIAQEAAKHKYGAERFQKAYGVFFLIAFCFYLPQLAIFSHGVTQEKGTFYPVEAVAYLKKHLPKGNIFTSYDVGGFLIWQLPEKKVFIDGRMPSWRNENAPANESKYAFGDYRKVFTDKTFFTTIVKKYDIDTLMVPKNEFDKKDTKILGMDIEKSNLLKWLFTPQLSPSYLKPQLKQLGWHEVYKDDKLLIFQKP